MPEETPPQGLWSDLAATPLSVSLREDTWAYPILEIAHIVGIALVFGSILAYDLRILGRTRTIPVGTLGRHLLPWVWTGFLINATSGALLFVSNPVEFAANTALQYKLALIALAGLNAAYFQWRVAPSIDTWNTDAAAPIPARLSALLSIGLWLTIIAAGRLMAYVV